MADVYRQYRESEVLQADPIKLVGLMYDGALRFARLARRAVEEQRIEDAHNNILRAYAIIAELRATLDFEQGKEIATSLEQVYEYSLYLLQEANIRKDAGRIDQVIGLIEPLSQTWHEAFSNKQSVVEGNTAKQSENPEKSEQASNHASLDLVG